MHISTINRIATEAYVSPVQPVKPVTSNAERAEIAGRLREAVRAAPAQGTGLMVDLSV